MASDTATPLLSFDNSYAALPQQFYTRQAPTPVAAPALIKANPALAKQLGIDPAWLQSDQGVATIAGNHVPTGAEPIATVYAGHQFGHWNPQLGDGRALLLGELTRSDGERFDLQLKGSGRTPYSRGGDGRSPLGPVLREYLVSEAMHSLGIPTTRALGAVTTGEVVYREGALPGAILARVARSHIRIGTFQFFASRQDHEALQLLADHVIQRHYPQLATVPAPYLALLKAVMERQATLVAQWQGVGFIHGVMNTDNMLISGETIDYGPCAFMDDYDPATVFSSIDHGGRYAYQNQPGIAHWNLAALAQALLPLLDTDRDKAVAAAQAAVDGFPGLYSAAYQAVMARKLGLQEWREEDDALLTDWLALLAAEKLDFTLAFRRLAELAAPEDSVGPSVSKVFNLPAACEPWLARWQQRLQEDGMDSAARAAMMAQANPLFIPRNHLVEAAIQAATRENDFSVFSTLLDIWTGESREPPPLDPYALPPRPEQVVAQTFCGT